MQPTPMRAFDMKIIDALTDLLYRPNLNARDGGDLAIHNAGEGSEDRQCFSRGGVAYQNGHIQTEEELEAERVEFKKSLARTDY